MTRWMLVFVFVVPISGCPDGAGEGDEAKRSRSPDPARSGSTTKTVDTPKPAAAKVKTYRLEGIGLLIDAWSGAKVEGDAHGANVYPPGFKGEGDALGISAGPKKQSLRETFALMTEKKKNTRFVEKRLDAAAKRYVYRNETHHESGAVTSTVEVGLWHRERVYSCAATMGWRPKDASAKRSFLALVKRYCLTLRAAPKSR
jgi:hypothetical protein